MRLTSSFVIVCVASLGACRDLPAPAAAHRRLHLEEEFAISLPRAAPVIGVAGEHAGRLVAWSTDSAYLVSATDPPVVLPVALAAAPAGAGMARNGTIELIDPGAGLLRRTEADGQGSDTPLPVGVRVRDAVRTEPHGWVIGGVDARGRYRVQGLDGTAWWVISPDTLPGGTLPPYRLSAAADGVLLTEAEPPFRTWRVGPDGPGTVFAPLSAGSPERQGVQRWVSAPVIDLGDGLVQTLADLASDRRVMILYDRGGREVRKTVLGVPMALVGITRDRRHLLAVRDVGSPEIVLYRWRWRSNHTQGAEP